MSRREGFGVSTHGNTQFEIQRMSKVKEGRKSKLGSEKKNMFKKPRNQEYEINNEAGKVIIVCKSFSSNWTYS